jgi:hypothetical protein
LLRRSIVWLREASKDEIWFAFELLDCTFGTFDDERIDGQLGALSFDADDLRRVRRHVGA